MKKLASSFFAACLSLGIGVPAITASANAAQPTALIAPAIRSGSANLDTALSGISA